ncbi:MAG: HEAT repeat domain-containing protein [Planctomycetota bacterium]|jgi:hypothetical protein
MSQGWDAWWHWSRNEFLIPQRQPLTDPQGRARSELSSILITQLRSGNAIVRSAAVRALGRVGGHGTVRHLLAQLRDPVLEVREDAILALGTTGRAAAVHALLHIARCGCAPGQGSPGTDAQVISSQSRTLAVLALALARRYGSHLDLDRLIRDLPVKIKNTKTDPAQHKHRDLAMAKLLYARPMPGRCRWTYGAVPSSPCAGLATMPPWTSSLAPQEAPSSKPAARRRWPSAPSAIRAPWRRCSPHTSRNTSI